MTPGKLKAERDRLAGALQLFDQARLNIEACSKIITGIKIIGNPVAKRCRDEDLLAKNYGLNRLLDEAWCGGDLHRVRENIVKLDYFLKAQQIREGKK